MKMIEVFGLKKSFGEIKVLDGVDLTIEKGETVAIIGPSGAGKSTLLRCLIDLEKANGGTILIEGEALCRDGKYVGEREAKRVCSKMGMVFQSFNLFPHLKVEENLMIAPVEVKKEPKELVKARAKEVLEKVGLSDKAASRPSELSGGQKQRVAIARALMMNPDVLLFDEPTSSLDPQLTSEVLSVMRDLAREKMTMAVVTHEMGFAREAASRILFMGDSKIIEEGPPDAIFGNPRDPRIREFMKSVL